MCSVVFSPGHRPFDSRTDCKSTEIHDEQVVLAPYDRVAIGGELLLFKWKALQTEDAGPIPTAEQAVMEFKRATQVVISLASRKPCVSLVFLFASREPAAG